MSRKSKISSIVKIKTVERYLNGEIGIRQAGRELGVNHRSIQRWISIYKSKGPVGLLDQSQNSHYSKELKLAAVNDYLNEKGSLSAICVKYGVRSEKQLTDWIKVYNSGGTFKTSTGGAYMKKQGQLLLMRD